MRDRLEREDLTVLAYRFAGDRFCRAERFAAYAAALGDRFVGRVLPDSAANTDVAPFFAERVSVPAQRGDGPPDRRSRPADHRRPRRDPGVLHPAPRATRHLASLGSAVEAQ